MGISKSSARYSRNGHVVLEPKGWVHAHIHRLAPILSVLALSASAGCTAILELNTDQCKVDADCAELFGATATYVCASNLCARPACDTDQSCKARGGVFATAICSTADNLCAPAQCTDNTQCGPGQTCSLSTNRCVPRECDTTQDCLQKKLSPTVACTQGFCVDDTWGCIGEPDPRVRNASESGTLSIPLLSSVDNTPVAGAQWQIKVCQPPQLDIDCAKPLPVPTPTYDAVTGIATVTGLSYDLPVRIQFDEVNLKDPDGQATLLPMDFYTQKPPVGVTQVPAVKVVSRMGLANLIASFSSVAGPGQAVDPALGNIYGLIFDCQDKPAANVSLAYTDALGMPFTPPPTILFFDEQIPSLTRTYSYPSGVFSSLNIPLQNLNVSTSLVVDPMSSSPKKRVIRSDYSMRLSSIRMTTVHFYPRAYNKK